MTIVIQTVLVTTIIYIIIFSLFRACWPYMHLHHLLWLPPPSLSSSSRSPPPSTGNQCRCAWFSVSPAIFTFTTNNLGTIAIHQSAPVQTGGQLIFSSFIPSATHESHACRQTQYLVDKAIWLQHEGPWVQQYQNVGCDHNIERMNYGQYLATALLLFILCKGT